MFQCMNSIDRIFITGITEMQINIKELTSISRIYCLLYFNTKSISLLKLL